MHSPCTRRALAVHSPCFRCAFAVHSPYIRYTFAMHLLYIRRAFFMRPQCILHASSVHPPCILHKLSMYYPCTRHTLAMHPPYIRRVLLGVHLGRRRSRKTWILEPSPIIARATRQTRCAARGHPPRRTNQIALTRDIGPEPFQANFSTALLGNVNSSIQPG